MFTRTWRIYPHEKYDIGCVSFDWSTPGHTRVLKFESSDSGRCITVTITRDHPKSCARELAAQLIDGYFANVRIDRLEEESDQ